MGSAAPLLFGDYYAYYDFNICGRISRVYFWLLDRQRVQ